MKKNMKALAMALGLTIVGSTTSVYASPGGLDANGGHHCYTNCAKYGLETGEYHYHNNWKQDNGKWYFYDKDGTKAKGWKAINGTWYYFYSNGQMAANTTIDGYVLGANGAMQQAQTVQTGWKQNGSVWNYYNENGVKQTGWKQISGVWYYFNGNGVMQTGWQQVGGAWYYFNGSGAMQTGWQQVGGVWYYFNGSGAMQTGWQQISGEWYYFNGSGAMQTNWQAISGAWYYFNGSGAMQTGWQQVRGAWYYFNGSGAMQTGWIQDNGKWYYLASDGIWDPNGLTEYQGAWSNVDLPAEIENWNKIPTNLSTAINFISGNEAGVAVAYTSQGAIQHAAAYDTVTFQNNKAVLNFENDGWGHSGKIEITLKDNKVYLNISINSGGSSAWGLPSGQYTLTHHYDFDGGEITK
ncbi:YHYH domain-containing protein [Bacillus sp. S13(2024)]|uniref:YHYH domain-containing protein n=1 Tax=unclassified Bacillus (in: firmicutes) TaxID=185979 RepID=UPI003D200CA8